MWVWGIAALLAIAVAVLLGRLIALSSSVKNIADEFNDIMNDDTNTLISLSVSNKATRHLVKSINRELRFLRDERRKLQNGDAELKKAVTNIAHDIRTPLTAISGYLDLLDNEEKSQDAAQYLSVVRERTDALKTLTEELFCYSVITSTADELKIEDVNICAEIEQSIAGYYGVLCERGIAPQIEMPDSSVVCKLDRQAVNRIFSNIISNAVKYSDGDFCVKATESGKIEFSNSAKALDEISVGKLFDRFYTVETGRTSTGLGLSIAKLLTERMGGRISARYENDRLLLTVDFSGEKK